MKKIALIIMMFAFITGTMQAQIVGPNAYIKGSFIHIGIAGCGGFEGVDTTVSPLPAGMYCRTNTQYFGFVANPQKNNWTKFDGDFFTPGSPENGWGITIGTNNSASNNCESSTGTGTQEAQIFGSIKKYSHNLSCYNVDWEGTDTIKGTNLDVKINYQLEDTDLYYTTTISVKNNTSDTIPELYYYRNMDPDNNVILSGDYETQNTIVSQPGSSPCEIAQVSATQSTPWNSYVGFAAAGLNWRASYGGFSNRNGYALWNATGAGIVNTVGSTLFADEAIELSYKITNLAPGATETFQFVTILADSAAARASDNLLYFTYPYSTNLLPSACSSPIIDTVISCGPILISITGSSVNDYSWTWTPVTGLSTTTGECVIVNNNVMTTYTAKGTPLAGTCLTPVAYPIVVFANSHAYLSPAITGSLSLCSGHPTTLDAGSGFSTYLWSNSDTTQDISVSSLGAYTVTVTNLLACTGTATATVSAHANPYAGFIASPDSGSIPLTVHFTDTSYSSGGYIVNWQWYFGDGSTGSGSHTSHVYSYSGYYGVILIITDNNGCIDTANETIKAVMPYSINEFYNNISFIIFPDPASNTITIENSQQGTIEITNIQGQLIESLATTGNKTIIDVSDFAKGMYFVIIKTEKGVAVKKFVKD